MRQQGDALEQWPWEVPVVHEAWMTWEVKSHQSFFINPIYSLTLFPRFCFSSSMGLYAYVLGAEKNRSWVWRGRRKIQEEERKVRTKGWPATPLISPLSGHCLYVYSAEFVMMRSQSCRFSSRGMKIGITHLWRRTHLWWAKWNDYVHSSEAAMQWISNWLTSK